MLDDLELYRRMLVIRRTEEKLLQLHSQALLSGTTHTSIGQESIAVGLLGVAWLITYYVAGQYIPFMEALGNWNILIGMGGMAAAFALATLWR